MKPIRLGVNVDHVATVRQARRGGEPDPVAAARASIRGGADWIVCHLREDRRHIQDDDLRRLRRMARRLNLEMGLAPEIVRIALRVGPDRVTLVPEKRQELTTEGGLDVAVEETRIARAVRRFHARGIEVSLFVDPDERQLKASRRTGVRIVEIHTGRYANTRSRRELIRVRDAARYARALGLAVAAGHGLTLRNVGPIAAIPEIEELNIGHSIVADAILMGMERAVRAMKHAMREARR